MSAPSVPKHSEIGNAFASQYYRHLVASPDTAHNFYHAEAGISRLRGAASEPIVGHEKIKAYIASSNYPSCKFLIDTIDSQEKGKGEILVLVSGIEIDEDKAVRPFCQTFVLEATLSGTRYLVRNDMLRYLRNEILIGESQKTETAQTETETPSEERVEVKEEQPLPVHVEIGTQVDQATQAVAKEEPQQQAAPQQQQEDEQPVPPATKQHKPVRAESKREAADPSKPRAWASVVKVTSNGALPAALATESVVVNPEVEEERENTPVSAAAADKPKTGRPEYIMNSLYVSNLGGCDTDEIKALFSRFGPVKNVQHTLSQGYCFVDFESAESADKALKGGPLTLGDSELKLERRRALSSARGGRGGRGGGRGGPPRGRGGPPREAREPRTTDRTERREPRGEPRPREGNDRRPPNKEGGARRGRGGGGAPRTAAPAAAASS